MVETQKSALEELMEKYKPITAAPSREDIAQSFGTRTQTQTKRLSSAPGATETLEIGKISKEMNSIQMDLAELAETYGKLGVNFKNLVGTDRLYSAKDALEIMVYRLLAQKQKAKGVKLQAIERKGNAIEILVNKMAEVLESQYEKARHGKEIAETVQVENIGLMKQFDKKLIKTLKDGHYSSSDMAAAQKEARRLMDEMKDIDGVLATYENQVMDAKAKGEMDSVKKLTDEMSQVLDLKYNVLDGSMAADGLVSKIRRSILDSAEGVQSAKGAIAASKVNYASITALIDSMSELEIKYRHAKDDMIPVFKIQGKIANMGMTALDIKKTLIEVAGISNRLMKANATLVNTLSKETFELLKTPIYDINTANEVVEQINSYQTQINDQRMAWAEMNQRLTDLPTSAHYASQQ